MMCRKKRKNANQLGEKSNGRLCLLEIVAYSGRCELKGKYVRVPLYVLVVLLLLQTRWLVLKHHFLIVDFNMVSTVIIVLACIIAVYGHGCTDLKLSASDQSVIDMMKRYLHTSRNTECSDNKRSNIFYVY